MDVGKSNVNRAKHTITKRSAPTDPTTLDPHIAAIRKPDLKEGLVCPVCGSSNTFLDQDTGGWLCRERHSNPKHLSKEE